MRIVSKYLSGHVVNARPKSNRPIRVKDETWSFFSFTAVVAVHGTSLLGKLNS